MTDGSRAVRVNLPADLGGGFTMVVCQLSQEATVRSFTAQVVGMCQATNTALLEPSDWGLSNPRDEDDDPDAPLVFLHPDTAIALILGEQADEAELDLNRLKAARVKPPARAPSRVQPVEAEDEPGSNEVSRNGAPSMGTPGRLSHQSSFRVSSDDEQEVGQWVRLFRVTVGRGADKETRWSKDPALVKSHFSPPDTPLPAQQTAMRYSLLQQLKRSKPPAAALPPGLICLLPPADVPSLSSPPASAHLTAGGSSQHELSRSNSSSQLSPHAGKQVRSKQEMKAEQDRLKERQREAASIDATVVALAAKGIGRVRVVKQASAKKKKGEEEEDEEGAEMEEERQHKARFAWCGGEREVPLLFASLPAPPSATPSKQKKKADPTDNCFVLTSLRALTVENGAVVAELRIGPGSGGVVSVPKRRPVETAGGSEVVRMRWKVRVLSNEASNVNEMGEEDDSGSDDGTDPPADGDEPAEVDEDGLENGHSGRRVSHSKPRFTYVTLSVPSTQQVAYIQQYILYMQSTVTLTQTLSILSSNSAMNSSLQSASSSANHALLGWTTLLKSFMGPLVFGPLRLPMYTHQIKQLLARVQQMQLKNVAIHSLKLLQFHLPHPELSDTGEVQQEDFIPSLSLRSFRPHPHNEYTFDVRWSCPSFLVRVEITGKKVVSFRLELEMRGIEVAGCVLLRSTPYAPEQLAVSFVSVPSLSFGVASQVVVGSVRMPAAVQQSLERLIAQQVQKVLAQQINERAIYPKWISVYFAKFEPNHPSPGTAECSTATIAFGTTLTRLLVPFAVWFRSPLSLLLDRWWSVAKFPFKFDGRDDEEMMGLALVVTTQAEVVVSETLREMRQRREDMEGFMTRPLHGEDEGSDWQDKEKLRLREKDSELKQQEDLEGSGGKRVKVKKKRATKVRDEEDEPPIREASRKKK